ncbi:hypothetical protein OROHE_027134 [Orobanche hederae]
MATGLLAKRAPSTIENTFSLFRCAFNFVRDLSTASSTTSTAANVSAPGGEAKKPKRKKKKNFFEVAQFLPNWGIGYHMAKTHWSGVSYEITKINLYKDGRHGKAWGVVHKDAVFKLRMPQRKLVESISGVGDIFRIQKEPKKVPRNQNPKQFEPYSFVFSNVDHLNGVYTNKLLSFRNGDFLSEHHVVGSLILNLLYCFYCVILDE